MNAIQFIGAVLAILVTSLGVIGGLLTLPSSLRKFRRDRKQHGTKGVGWAILSRDDRQDGITVKFLVVEDLMQFISYFAKPEFRGVVTKVEAIGDYYQVTMEFPPGADLRYTVVKRR